MKKLLLLSIFSFAFMFSCSVEDEETYPIETLTDTAEDFEFMLLDKSATMFSLDGTSAERVIDLGALVAVAAAPKSSDISYSYDIVDPTDAILDDQFTSGGSGTIPAGQLSGVLPIKVNLDNCEIGKLYTISLQLTSSGLSQFINTPLSYSFAVVCPSELDGEYAAETTVNNLGAGITWDGCEGSTWSGTVVITQEGIGSYIFSTVGPTGETWADPSMGAYYACYETSASNNLPNGDIRINDVCGQLSFSGSSQWSEVYSFSQVDPNGDKLTITWSNDYGESGTTVLTNPNGDWPTTLRF